MDGTETGWGRPAEPAPRWRALLDRARHGARAAEEQAAETEREAPPAPPQQFGQPLPTRRPYNPLDPRSQQPPAGQQPGYEQSGYEQPGFDQRAPEQQFEPRPMPQRPINPLDPRHQVRQPSPQPQPSPPPHPEPNGRRGVPEQPHSFFSPSSAPARSTPAAPPAPIAPPPITPPPAPQRDYPRGRASAAAPVRAPSPAPAPTSPAGARIEWRQTEPSGEMERAVAVLRRKLGKPRVLAFANPKGGVHKTTATVLAAATIGSVRGRGVLAWDDNELRGTLGLRAGSARHARTIKHLLADLMQIENLHGDGLLSELDAYLRHASDGSYDVLAGEENPRFAQRLDQGTVRRVMDLLRRTHDVICVDTGNNVESVNWQTVMRQADQLVITTVPREDAAFTADWMLDVLDESGMGDLVANAVTLISCPSPGPLPMLADFAKHFATRTRGVAVVPYDPSLEVGSSIEYQDLQPETKQAWLKAASMMIEPFAE
ncbi:MinD/ParA family ATP-binding protein [Paractinoplanes durhamensis]|uniref:MinD/ParA family ATP-binding protein n=1 Tax=Paractinoplanes durhamensis TaxID=113563 RepID=UPI0031DD7F1C